MVSLLFFSLIAITNPQTIDTRTDCYGTVAFDLYCFRFFVMEDDATVIPIHFWQNKEQTGTTESE
jgi:hypothetical protein